MKSRWIIALAVALVTGALTHFAGEPRATAADGGSVAYLAAESRKGAPLELTIFNTTTAAMDLDLVLRDAEGTAIINRPGEISLGPRETAFISMDEQLKRLLPRRTAPYRGPLAIEVCGTGLFDPDNVVLRATQFFGRRARPRGAVVYRPVWADRSDP